MKLVLDNDVQRRYSRLAGSNFPFDLTPVNILRIGLELSLKGTTSVNVASPADELQRELKELEATLRELSERRGELEMMHEKKMKHDEERAILEYYLWITDQQVRKMERKLMDLDGKG